MNFNKTEESETKEDQSQFFHPSIAKIAVAQIFQSIGFTGSQSSALEALTNIATKYLQTIASSASLNANTSRRTECNLSDVIHAIEDINSIQGFNGASNANRSLLKSGILREIMNFVRSVDEIPFAKPIPRRITAKRSDFLPRLAKSKKVQYQGRDQGKYFSHIPPWVPKFPDPSTYKNVGIRVCREERIGFRKEENNVVLEKSIVGNAEKVVDLKDEEKRVLPVERPKVSFKLGLGLGFSVEVGLRNGVCRGFKKVSWHNGSVEEENKSLKRRR